MFSPIGLLYLIRCVFRVVAINYLELFRYGPRHESTGRDAGKS